MEIKIDAKCPRCGANIQLHHISDIESKPCKLEFLDKTFEIGKASSQAAAENKMKPELRSNRFELSAKDEVVIHFNNLFKAVGHADDKKELISLRKQIAKSKLKVKRDIEDEFKEGKAEVLKEIDGRLIALSKKKERKGLVFRGLFDGKKH